MLYINPNKYLLKTTIVPVMSVEGIYIYIYIYSYTITSCHEQIQSDTEAESNIIGLHYCFYSKCLLYIEPCHSSVAGGNKQTKRNTR